MNRATAASCTDRFMSAPLMMLLLLGLLLLCVCYPSAGAPSTGFVLHHNSTLSIDHAVRHALHMYMLVASMAYAADVYKKHQGRVQGPASR
jgi:hypothetical protein